MCYTSSSRAAQQFDPCTGLCMENAHDYMIHTAATMKNMAENTLTETAEKIVENRKNVEAARDGEQGRGFAVESEILLPIPPVPQCRFRIYAVRSTPI